MRTTRFASAITSVLLIAATVANADPVFPPELQTTGIQPEIYKDVAPAIGTVDGTAEKAPFRDTIALYQANDLEGAEKKIREFLKSEPTNVTGNELLGTILLARGQSAAAKKILEEVITSRPNSVFARLQLAKLCIESKDMKSAEQQYAATEKIDGTRPEVALGIGIIRETQGNLDAAIANYEKVIGAKPDKYLSVRINLARLYVRQKQFPKAVAVLQGMAGASQQNMSVHETLAIAKFGSGDFDGAIATVKAAQAINPDHDFSFLLETMFSTAGRMSEVEAQQRDFLKRNPNSDVAHGRLAETLLAKHKTDEAIEHFKKAASLAKDAQPVLIRIGDIYQAEKRNDEAEATYKEATVAFPKSPVAYVRLGLLYEATSRYPDSLAALKKAAELSPEDPLVRESLSWAYYRTGDKDKAVTLAAETVKTQPDNKPAKLFLASLYDRTGDTENAAAQYRNLLKLEPNNVVVLNNLANCLAERKDFDEAEKLAQKAVELVPDSGSIKDTLGWIQFRNKKTNPAKATLENAVNQSADDPSVRYHLAIVYRQSGEKDKSLEQLRTAVKLSTTFPEYRECISLIGELTKSK